MTESIRGFLLAATAKNTHKGLWFVFHHEDSGILAFDLTQEHPDVPYQRFATVLDSEDRKPQSDKIVLLGGPMESDKSMILLHNKPQVEASHVINDDFSFLSYRYVVVPGKPPAVTKADNTPSRINLGDTADFIVSVGFRLWEIQPLRDELAQGLWTLVPATPDLIYRTSRQDRLQRALLSIN